MSIGFTHLKQKSIMFESLRKKQKLCDVNQTSIVFLDVQLFIRAYNLLKL